MNKVILIGNLTKDPEVSQTNDGKMYARMTIAVSRDYTNQDGTRDTDFFDFTVWEKRAEICDKYLKKGSKVAIVGSIQNHNYTDNNGEKRYTQEVKCKEIEFLSSKKSDDTPGERTRPELAPINDDEPLPF